MSPKACLASQAFQVGLFPGEEAKWFKKGDDPEHFVKLLCINFTWNGIDAVACCQDPDNGPKMVDILIHCSKLN